ncbi:MAG TPA: hypothetical protein VFZ77_18810 [Acidimicrobiales bacterium]
MTVRAVAVAFAAAVGASVPAPAAGGQEGGTGPTATVVQQAAAVADVVDVIGAGWRPGGLVAAALCGNEAARGSIDCLPHEREIGVGPDGTFHLAVTVRVPPSPCPCVILVTGLEGGGRAVVPLEVDGVPRAPVERPEPAPVAEVAVDEARLEGGGPWTSWFGAGATRTLVLVVRNSGNAPADARLTVTAGPGDDPDGWVPSPGPVRVEAGERRIVRVPVRFEPLGFGRHSVVGAVAAGGGEQPFRASAGVHPWGLYGLAAVVLLVLVGVPAGRRRRRRRPDGAPPAPPGNGAEIGPGRSDGARGSTDAHVASDGRRR